MGLLVFGVILPWLVVGLGCWLGYQLVRQNGRILLRLDSMEERLAQSGLSQTPARLLDPASMLPMAAGTAPSGPLGLPIGSPAPPFELPDLAGNHISLEHFRGQRVLLMSWDPGCGFCREMAPDLAALPADGADGRPVPIVIATGDTDQNQRLVEEHGIRCPVLVQGGHEVTTMYQATGTPMGYLVDERGAIASELAVGAQALLSLFAHSSSTTVEGVATGSQNGHEVSRNTRTLEDSRLVRDGLPIGTPAPAFRLPRVDGGELSLQEFRGRRVLLVFSDPHCGPCMELAPKLEQLHRRPTDLQVIMISRGDMEANRAKSTEYGLTFPVVLQQHWEISRAYGMFATPIGYLIDEHGIIISDVASGVDAILALTSREEAATR